jgi:hypothetical protein
MFLLNHFDIILYGLKEWIGCFNGYGQFISSFEGKIFLIRFQRCTIMIDIFIVIIYFLTLIIVFGKMIEEINQTIVILVDQSALESQITQQNLTEILEIKFNFIDSYRNQSLMEIPLELKNKSLTQAIYVNWQYSTFSNFKGRSQRLIYHVPGLTMDLFQPQIFTVIAPDQTIEAKLLTENCLIREETTGALIAKNPIFDWKQLKEIIDGDKSFSLQLVFQITDPIYQSPQINLNTLKCKFLLEEISWRQVLYWKSKKKKG